MKNYLDEQWEKIEYKTRVSSIKNISNHLAVVFSIDSEELMNDIRNYYELKEDALFLNEYQFIDTKPFQNKHLYNCKDLKEILYNEYYISVIDDDKIEKYIIKITNEKPLPLKPKLLLDFPEEMIDIFYQSHIQSLILMSDDLGIVKILNEYLAYKNVPRNINQIYSDLTGAIETLTKKKISYILCNYKNFRHLHNGYWIGTKVDREIEEQLLINYLLYKNISNKSIDELIHIFIDKLGKANIVSIAVLLENMQIAGIEVNTSEIEVALLNANYIELYPGYWESNQFGLYLTSKFNITKRWNDIYSYVLESLTKTTEIETFKRRIIGGATLEEVGIKVGVTRERIRQIEKKIRIRMTHPKTSYLITCYYRWLKKNLIEDKILSLLEMGISKHEYKILDLVLYNYFQEKHILRISGDILIYKLEYDRLVKQLNILAKVNKLIKVKELEINIHDNKKLLLYERVFIEEYNMIKLSDDEYFYPQGKISNEEEVYLIIYKCGRPVYYKEIPELAKKYGLPYSTKPGRNTLATMQRLNLFTRIAPGTFALQNWEMKSHIFIKDLIYEVIEQEDRPLVYEEFFELVKAKRYDEIKEHSFQSYLSECNDIVYIYTKEYILADWFDDEDKLNRYNIDKNRITYGNYLYNNKVIIEVFRRNNKFLTKYKMSEGSLNSQSLRISSKVGVNFGRRITIIDKNNVFTFNSYNVSVNSNPHSKPLISMR